MDNHDPKAIHLQEDTNPATTGLAEPSGGVVKRTGVQDRGEGTRVSLQQLD